MTSINATKRSRDDRFSERFVQLKSHATKWEPTRAKSALQLEMDACIVPNTSDNTLRADTSNIIVIDGLIDDELRSQLLAHLTNDEFDETPPADTWVQGTVDDAQQPIPSWGLTDDALASLPESPAVQEVNSRLCKLYPDLCFYHMPSSLIQHVRPGTGREAVAQRNTEEAVTGEPQGGGRCTAADCCCFLANAAVVGGQYLWHVDADPSEFPRGSEWSEHYGCYPNRECGKPRFVSMMVYLNSKWDLDCGGETLFLDSPTDTGVLVRPKAGRIVLMDQDVVHKINAVSTAAKRPRYSLVWKMIVVNRNDSSQMPRLTRPQWGRQAAFGSAHKMALIQETLCKS